jgi:hypothetical protein
MAVAEHAEETETHDSSGNGARSTALKAAAAAAATGAVSFAVKKALSHDGSSNDEQRDGEGSKGKRSSSGPSSLLASAGASAWEAASEALLPLAENAADAAGRYLAERAPDVVRERIVPRFVDAFNDAS